MHRGKRRISHIMNVCKRIAEQSLGELCKRKKKGNRKCKGWEILERAMMANVLKGHETKEKTFSWMTLDIWPLGYSFQPEHIYICDGSDLPSICLDRVCWFRGPAGGSRLFITHLIVYNDAYSWLRMTCLIQKPSVLRDFDIRTSGHIQKGRYEKSLCLEAIVTNYNCSVRLDLGTINTCKGEMRNSKFEVCRLQFWFPKGVFFNIRRNLYVYIIKLQGWKTT